MLKLIITFSITVFVLSLLSCGKVRNSSSSDGGSVVGSAEYVSAMEVLSSKCLRCHSTWSAYSSDDYVKNGKVFKGSPSNSSLYTRIRGNDAGIAGDMPQGEPNLSVTEMRAIKDWINSL